MEQTPTSQSPPPLEQPEPKKIKMSTTSDDDEECGGDTATAASGADKKPRYKRRKVAIFFAYCGVGYQGMQKNPGAKTVEGDLEEALYHSGGVPDHDRYAPRRYDFARSARTDKGVSAVGQVISGRFYVDPPGFVDRLNANLSPQIRVFGFKRVTGAFNAKKFCDRRRYVYLIPVFALDPSAHRDRESVLASLGSENVLAKCSECSDRGRKVEGLMGKRSYELTGMSFEPDISSNSCEPKVDGVKVQNGDSEINDKDQSLIGKQKNELNGTSSESSILSNSCDAKVDKVENVDSEINLVEVGIKSDEKDQSLIGEASNNIKDTSSGISSNSFSYGESERERFNRILKQYEGTHNFHNFTTRTKAEDPSAKRFIISFTANTVVTIDGLDFVKCEVVGQSFMLHQIRKMIGLAVAIMRNCAPESLIEKALKKDISVNVPTAPEVGLFLDECFFSSYNQKWKDSHEELSMKAYAEEAESFKMKYIYAHIASTEQKEGVVGLWLHSLNHRNYPDLRLFYDSENATNNNGSNESTIEGKNKIKKKSLFLTCICLAVVETFFFLSFDFTKKIAMKLRFSLYFREINSCLIMNSLHYFL